MAPVARGLEPPIEVDVVIEVPRGSFLKRGSTGAVAETRSQNSRRRADRRSGGLPAINAAVMAPIDTPTTHVGAWPASARPS